MAGQEAAIGALGIIVLAGVIGRLFLRKTGISDVLLLLVFGAAAGAFIPASAVDATGSFLLPLSAITLLMIILDEGLHLSFENLFRSAHKALLFGIISFALSFAATFAIFYFVASFPLFLSLVIAAIFSSVAPEMLSGFLYAIDSSESSQAIGGIESTLSDALSVMITLLLLGSALRQPASVQLSFFPSEIIFIFLLSVACGSIAAAIWKAALIRIAEGSEHLLAIGVAAALYAVSGAIGASGVISVFVFGFFLGNISHKSIDDVRKFQSEVSFFLRTFFFIYLGVLLFHSPKPLEIALIALTLSIFFAFARMVASGAAYFLDHTSRKGRLLETVSSRGLTSAVLAVVVSQEMAAAGVQIPIDLPLLALFVIFFTNLISAFLVFRKKGK